MKEREITVPQIIEMFEILLNKDTENKLFVFFGNNQLPSDLTIYEIVQQRSKAVEQVHVQGGDKTPFQNVVTELADSKVHAILRYCGNRGKKTDHRLDEERGLAEVRALFKEYAISEKTSKNADILQKLSEIGGEYQKIEDVAEAVYMSVRQVLRRRDEALKQLAFSLKNKIRRKYGDCTYAHSSNYNRNRTGNGVADGGNDSSPQPEQQRLL